MNFFEELKRRRVVRVLLVYLASAFALLEAADIVISALSLPSWLLQAAIAALTVGLPVSLVLSWVYDITPEGVVPTDDRSATERGGGGAGSPASRNFMGGIWIYVLLILTIL